MEYKNINKCYSNDFMELYHCDCMELLKQTPDNYYSLALVDPPYGIGMGSGAGETRGNGKKKRKTFIRLKIGMKISLLPNIGSSCLGCQKIKSFGEAITLLNIFPKVEAGFIGGN